MVGSFRKTAHFGNRFLHITLRCHTVSIATDSAKYISERIRDRGAMIGYSVPVLWLHIDALDVLYMFIVIHYNLIE
jgi:hypothetical protein